MNKEQDKKKQQLDDEFKNANRMKSSRLNPLYILLTLKNHSSAAQPITMKELLTRLNASFTEGGEKVNINQSTVFRTMEDLLGNENFAFPATITEEEEEDCYSDPHNLGFSVHCVVKAENAYVPFDPELHEKMQKYYYCQSVFSDAELKTLIDSVEAYNYFSAENITTLINKLLRLNPTSPLTKATYLPDKSLKDPESAVLQNIETFSRLIQEKKLAEITYYTYTYDKKMHQPVLAPREHYPRVVRPVSMMWSNGNYYLIAMLGPAPKFTPTNFRMDRIVIEDEITPTPEAFAALNPPSELSPTIYRLKHPVMFGGKEEDISMLCRETQYNNMLNVLVDTFGTLAHCRPATKEELEKYLGYGTTYCPSEEEKWIHVRVRTTRGGVELFAEQNCRNCRVISPQAVADRVQRNLEYGISFYTGTKAPEPLKKK